MYSRFRIPSFLLSRKNPPVGPPLRRVAAQITLAAASALLRLVAARERMLSERLDTATAAFEVGFESAIQFSREYKRFFGQPPITDVKSNRLASAQWIRAKVGCVQIVGNARRYEKTSPALSANVYLSIRM